MWLIKKYLDIVDGEFWVLMTVSAWKNESSLTMSEITHWNPLIGFFDSYYINYDHIRENPESPRKLGSNKSSATFVVFKSFLRKVILIGENKTCDMSIARRVFIIHQMFQKSKEINMHYCTEVSYNENKSCYMYASLFLKKTIVTHPFLVIQSVVMEDGE